MEYLLTSIVSHNHRKEKPRLITGFFNFMNATLILTCKGKECLKSNKHSIVNTGELKL